MTYAPEHLGSHAGVEEPDHRLLRNPNREATMADLTHRCSVMPDAPQTRRCRWRPHRARDGVAAPAFILLLTYAMPVSRVDELLDEHRAWLDEHFADGTFLVSGPQVPLLGPRSWRAAGRARRSRPSSRPIRWPARVPRPMRSSSSPPRGARWRRPRRRRRRRNCDARSPDPGQPCLPRADGPRPRDHPRHDPPAVSADARLAAERGLQWHPWPTRAWRDGTGNWPPSPCSPRSETPPLSSASTSTPHCARASPATSCAPLVEHTSGVRGVPTGVERPRHPRRAAA